MYAGSLLAFDFIQFIQDNCTVTVTNLQLPHCQGSSFERFDTVTTPKQKENILSSLTHWSQGDVVLISRVASRNTCCGVSPWAVLALKWLAVVRQKDNKCRKISSICTETWFKYKESIFYISIYKRYPMVYMYIKFPHVEGPLLIPQYLRKGNVYVRYIYLHDIETCHRYTIFINCADDPIKGHSNCLVHAEYSFACTGSVNDCIYFVFYFVYLSFPRTTKQKL